MRHPTIAATIIFGALTIITNCYAQSEPPVSTQSQTDATPADILIDQEILDAFEGEMDVHTTFSNVTKSGIVEQMSYAAKGAAGTELIKCTPGRVWGCKSNDDCTNSVPKAKSCTATQKVALLTCVYTISVGASFCNSSDSCWCQVEKKTSIDRISVLLGCPRAGTQTATCVPK